MFFKRRAYDRRSENLLFPNRGIDWRGHLLRSSPPNDDWINRSELEGANFEFTGSTYEATFELGDPSKTRVEVQLNGHIDSNTGSIWYTWTSPIDGYAVLSIPPDSNLSENVRPQLIVFTDSPVDLNTEVAALLEVVPGYYASFPAHAGETYALGLVANSQTNITYNIRLQASPVPIILEDPKSQTVRAGSACFFTVIAPGCGTNTNVRWTHDGAEIPGANGPSLLVKNASAASAGEYRAHINVLHPDAITISEPALLIVEGEDIQPRLRIQNVVGATNNLTLHVVGETNQFYAIRYANFAFDSSVLVPDPFRPYTSQTFTSFITNGAVVAFQPNALSAANFRAERIGDLKDACIANLRRLDFAKQTWSIEKHIGPGAAFDSAVETYMDGKRVRCPLGGFITYFPIGTPPVCSVPEHHL